MYIILKNYFLNNIAFLNDSFLLFQSVSLIFKNILNYILHGSMLIFVKTDLKKNFYTLKFDSYMLLEEDLPKGFFRLLEVDNQVVLPVKTHIRLLVTASDVLHS